MFWRTFLISFASNIILVLALPQISYWRQRQTAAPHDSRDGAAARDQPAAHETIKELLLAADTSPRRGPAYS
jgi:hypothetical protein